VEEPGCPHFVDVRVEDLVHEANAGGLVRILVRQLDVYLPNAARERRYAEAQTSAFDYAGEQ
jgi:hypothetical protein